MYRITVNPNQGGNMAVRMCSCCLTKPVKKGNYFLCDWCYSPQSNGQQPAERNIPTEEDALELMVRVAIMERVPPIPVKHFSRDDYSQEQLRAILDGG
jgi:hypothetical protein